MDDVLITHKLSIVAVERVAQRMRWVVEIALAAVDQINVHPAVVVIIEKSAARAAGFWQKFFR